MPRKLNKLPESMSAANDNNKKHLENPATMPASNLEDTVKINLLPGGPRNKETLAKTLELNEKNNQIEALRGERAAEALREQINTSKEDRTSGKELVEARKALDLVKAKKDQDKVISKAAAFGLSQAQFLQMLDNGPLEENESKSFFGTITNTFRRLAGQPWAGKDAKKLNELMESYRAAERTVDTANAEALENVPSNARPRYRVTDANQMSAGGDSFDEVKKSVADMVNPETYKMTGKVGAELAKLKAEEESNPGGTANALLEKYQVAIGKGRTIAKNGKLAYENQGVEELSVADLVKNQTLLKQAYDQILEKSEKDANRLVDAIAEIRNENSGSALATEDISKGRGVAVGRKQAAVGMGGLQTVGAGAGASALDRGLSERLQNFDTKKAKAEFAEEAAIEAEQKAEAKRLAKAEAAKAREDADDTARAEAAKPKAEAIRAEYSEREKQIELEAAWLKNFGKADARKAYALMKPNATETELKVANGAMIANNYRAMLTEEAVIEAKLKRKAPGITGEQLKALRASLDAVRAFAATVSVELSDEDIEVLNHEERAPAPPRSKPPEVPAVTRADLSRLDKLAEDRYAKEDASAAALAKLDKLAEDHYMNEVAAIGRKKMEAIAAQDRAKASANEDADTYAKPRAKAPKLAKGLSTKKRAG